MTPDLILFSLLAIVAVSSALGMLFSRNAIYSALFLIINFATVAVFYLILGAAFIAMVQVTVYAGAIMVLFLFVIMLLGAERLSPSGTLSWQRPLAIALGLILLAEAAYLLFYRIEFSTAAEELINPNFGSPTAVGDVLFNQYLLPFEITSVLLLVAMIGAIVLTFRERRSNQ
ncbi:MAG: NADH-quinone oxidoreductase subunit J [Anaerolineales bacterium]|jgi:NADH-quinone oxidoreductase subunit J